MLTLKGVTKQYFYGDRLFGALDLEVKNGEIVAILGAVGSGKTSLLKTIAGIEEHEGEILLDGNPIKKKTDDIIMVFDDGAVFKNKTVFDNLAYPLVIRKTDKTEIAKKVISAAENFGIGACLTMRASKLSEEEKRRMSAARLLLRESKLVIVDDLTAGLPKEQATPLFDDLAKVLYDKSKNGASVIYATDDRTQAFYLADKILVLVGGQIKQIGTRADMWKTPKSLWAAQAIDKDYNHKKATLTLENEVLKLVFDNQDNNFVLDISGIKDSICPSFFNGEVYVGFHKKDVTEGGIKEKVRYVFLSHGAYILQTESGIKIACDKKLEEVSYVPKVNALTLFDAATENSIMRNK